MVFFLILYHILSLNTTSKSASGKNSAIKTLSKCVSDGSERILPKFVKLGYFNIFSDIKGAVLSLSLIIFQRE